MTKTFQPKALNFSTATAHLRSSRAAPFKLRMVKIYTIKSSDIYISVFIFQQYLAYLGIAKEIPIFITDEILEGVISVKDRTVSAQEKRAHEITLANR